MQLGKRAQVRRARAGSWTAETERRFLGALASTKDLAIALRSAGASSSAAYRRRGARAGFAQGWRDALACDDPEILACWAACVAAMLDDDGPDPDNPVRITSVGEVLRLYRRSLRPGWRMGRPPR